MRAPRGRDAWRLVATVLAALLALSGRLSEASGTGLRFPLGAAPILSATAPCRWPLALALRGGREPAPLPAGWAEFLDPEYQIPYFYNAATGQTVWERPAAPVAPVPPPPPPPPPQTAPAPPQHAATVTEWVHTVSEPANPVDSLGEPAAGGGEQAPPAAGPAPPSTWWRGITSSAINSLSMPVDVERVAAVAAQGTSTLSRTNIAGLKVFKSDHAGVLKDYGLGVLRNVIDAAGAPLDHILDGIGTVGDVIMDKADRILGKDEALQKNSSAVCLQRYVDATLGHTREEWQVAQGTNFEGYNYTSYRHKRYGMLLELCHEAYGSFNYKLCDGQLVRRCTAITDFILENRDYLHHPKLAQELQEKSDNDMYALYRYPVVPSGSWEASCLHQHVIIRHKSIYDKNNVTIVLIPDGFIFFSRGDTCNISNYKKRDALIVRQGLEATVHIKDAKDLLVKLVGSLRGLTHFSAVVDKVSRAHARASAHTHTHIHTFPKCALVPRAPLTRRGGGSFAFTSRPCPLYFQPPTLPPRISLSLTQSLSLPPPPPNIHILFPPPPLSQEPLDYNHLLEEGERILGHDRSLEETWVWHDKHWRVIWEEQYSSYVITPDDTWSY
jgi:hypothetical protein